MPNRRIKNRAPHPTEPCTQCGAETAKWPGLATLCVKCRVPTRYVEPVPAGGNGVPDYQQATTEGP